MILQLRASLSAIGAVVLIAGTFVLAGLAPVRAADLVAEIRDVLQSEGRVLPDATSTHVAVLQDFYQGRGFQPLWRGPNGANAQAAMLLAVLQRADQEGLDPGDYLGDMPNQARDDRPLGEGRAELQTSMLLLRYVSDLRTGRSWLVQFDTSFVQVDRIEDRRRVLEAAAEAVDLESFLGRMAPASPAYGSLRAALAKYRAYAEGPAWSTIPGGEALKPGIRDPRVALVRARLEAVDAVPRGDAASADRDLYDPQLAASIAAFQHRFGLTSDRVVGRATLRALNRQPAQLIETIMLNMERLRWMPDNLGERHVLVNIAAFSLVAVDGEDVLEMRAIVGTPYRMTPVFSDRIGYLEFNPYWTVPRRIVVEDLIPKLRSSPDYLRSQKIRIFDGWDDDATEVRPEDVDWHAVPRGSIPYRFRQDPGPHNALGRVKFMFPNKYDVYIHDTPSRSLFRQDSRPFSSGCIRVEKPLELAAFLLRRDARWDVAKLQGLIDSGVTSRLYLADPVPVHLTYVTAWVDADGEVQFREDVYGRDRNLAEAVARH